MCNYPFYLVLNGRDYFDTIPKSQDQIDRFERLRVKLTFGLIKKKLTFSVKAKDQICSLLSFSSSSFFLTVIFQNFGPSSSWEGPALSTTQPCNSNNVLSVAQAVSCHSYCHGTVVPSHTNPGFLHGRRTCYLMCEHLGPPRLTFGLVTQCRPGNTIPTSWSRPGNQRELMGISYFSTRTNRGKFCWLMNWIPFTEKGHQFQE